MSFGIGLFVCLFIIAALTMPAGIGGGILFTPLLQASAGMSPKQAGALSQILISGAATASILFNIRAQMQKPDYDGLKIQAHYIYLTLPSLLSGTLAGVYLSKLMPNILQMLALFFICTYGSHSIYKKAMKVYAEETAQLAKSQPAELQLPTSQQHEIGNKHVELKDDEDSNSTTLGTAMPTVISLNSVTVTTADTHTESANLPMKQETPLATPSFQRQTSTVGAPLPELSVKRFVTFILAFFIGTILLTLIKGGKGKKSIIGLKPCGVPFFIIVIFQILAELGIAIYYCPQEWRFIMESWFIGTITTMTGASPGILQNPLMMSKGLSPIQSTPISVITTFVTASTSSLDYLMGGTVPFWMVFLSSITFAGSIGGMTAITYVIKKTGRASVIIFLLAAMAAVGGVTVLISGITGAFASIKNGDNPLAFEITC